MLPLTDQWDALLAEQPDDWSHLTLSLVLGDRERMEEAALLLCPANPWHGTTWRTGLLRFRAARTEGYGASATLLRALLGRLDAAAIEATLAVTDSLDAVALVATQGPTF